MIDEIKVLIQHSMIDEIKVLIQHSMIDEIKEPCINIQWLTRQKNPASTICSSGLKTTTFFFVFGTVWPISAARSKHSTCIRPYSPQHHVAYDRHFQTVQRDSLDTRWQVKAGFLSQRESDKAKYPGWQSTRNFDSFLINLLSPTNRQECQISNLTLIYVFGFDAGSWRHYGPVSCITHKVKIKAIRTLL